MPSLVVALVPAQLRRFCLAASLLAAAVGTACQVLTDLDAPLPPAGPASNVSGEAGAPAEAGPSPAGDGGADLSAYARAVLADQPVLYLRFSETAGGRVEDRSGQGNTSNVTGAFQRGRPGLIVGDPDPSVAMSGGQLLLDAKFDYPLTRDFTWEVWVRLDEYGEIIANLVNSPPNLQGTSLYTQNQDPWFGFERWSANGTLIREAHVGPARPTVRPVYHLVVVNRAARTDIFVNGSRTQGITGPGGTMPAAASLVVGGAKGDYDELAIYDKALSDARVVEHYSLGHTP